jgi:hypothetical protein
MALGAGAGGQAFDVGEQLLRGERGAFGAGPKLGFGETLATQAGTAGTDVAVDLALTALPGSAARAAKRGQQALLGITPEAVLEFERAALRGVRLGIEQVSESGLVRRFRNVAGRFPPLAGPLQRGQKRSGAEAAEALQDTLDSIAPVGTYVDLGANFRDAARRNVAGLRGVINRNYERFAQLASENDARVPLRASRAFASDLVQRAREFGGPLGRAAKEAEKVLKLGRSETAASTIVDAAGRPVRSGGVEIKPVDVRRWRGAVQELDVAIRQLSDEGNPVAAGELAQLRKAMEHDLGGIQGPPQVRAALAEANASFERFARLFRDVPQGQRLQRADPQLFGSLQGSRGLAQQEVDRLYDTVFRQQIKSPQAMEDLARIVGDPKLMKRAGVNMINEVGHRAIQFVEETGQTHLNLRLLSQELGVFDRRNPKRRSLEMTIGRQNLKNLEETIRSIERVADTAYVNVSDFVARRGLLGGARSVVRSFTPGLDTTDNFTAALRKATGLVVVIMNGRRFGNFITDPRAMRAAAEALSTAPGSGKQISARGQALLRLARVAPEFLDVEGTGEGLLPVTQREGFAGESLRAGARMINLAPLALGGAASLPRATRRAGTAIAGVSAGEVIQDLEDIALSFVKQGKQRGREFEELSGRRAREFRERRAQQ